MPSEMSRAERVRQTIHTWGTNANVVQTPANSPTMSTISILASFRAADKTLLAASREPVLSAFRAFCQDRFAGLCQPLLFQTGNTPVDR
ncbi:hypothetical protein YWS52_21030 [Chitiniphilus shinanonensis]